MSQGLSTFISEKWTRRWIQRKQKCILCQQRGHLACITDLFGFHTILMRPSDYHWLCHRHKSFLDLTSHHLHVAMKAGHDRFLKPGLKTRCFNIIDFNSFRWLKYTSSVRKRQGRCLGFWFMYADLFCSFLFSPGGVGDSQVQPLENTCSSSGPAVFKDRPPAHLMSDGCWTWWLPWLPCEWWVCQWILGGAQQVAEDILFAFLSSGGAPSVVLCFSFLWAIKDSQWSSRTAWRLLLGPSF